MTRAIFVLTLALALVGCGSTAPDTAPTPLSAERDIVVRDGRHALGILMAGNNRFASGLDNPSHMSSWRRHKLTKGQHPFGVVLGCADSRVSPELIFDVGLGDLFVIRVAGNVSQTDEAGSIEYAMLHLHTPLVVVLGHDGCGAVTAVVSPPEGEEPEELTRLLRHVKAGVGEVEKEQPRNRLIRMGVEANVRHQVSLLSAIRERASEQHSRVLETLIVGAVYDLSTGRVRILAVQ